MELTGEQHGLSARRPPGWGPVAGGGGHLQCTYPRRFASAKLRKEKAEMRIDQGAQCSFHLRPVGFAVFVASLAVEKLGHGPDLSGEVVPGQQADPGC